VFALEDIIADSFEEQQDDDEDEECSGSRGVACEKVAKLVKLSGRIASDAAFARQVKRKHAQ
jgi:hypothetical protein